MKLKLNEELKFSPWKKINEYIFFHGENLNIYDKYYNINANN